MSKITIFAPDDLEFNFNAIGLEGIYFIPGDIPTNTVLRLLALEAKVAGKTDEEFKNLQQGVVDAFADRHSSEELEKLNKALGFNSTMQVLLSLIEHISKSGDEIKNKMARVQQKTRAEN